MSDDFGRRLRGLRESRRLSLRGLARLAAISPSCLSRIERGRLPPPADPTIAKIAGALAADPEGLLEAAGRLPVDVRARLLRRPRLMARLVRAADALSDDRLEAFCGEVARAASDAGGDAGHPRRREAL
ncbi:MAG TPA: helix-turn-helix transcriptional regulator [Thermoanaerobaculia bacterium]|nr:helix-turn-helix transcriptional regulator [Thermoanaerobaculia bacterium]